MRTMLTTGAASAKDVDELSSDSDSVPESCHWAASRRTVGESGPVAGGGVESMEVTHSQTCSTKTNDCGWRTNANKGDGIRVLDKVMINECSAAGAGKETVMLSSLDGVSAAFASRHKEKATSPRLLNMAVFHRLSCRNIACCLNVYQDWVDNLGTKQQRQLQKSYAPALVLCTCCCLSAAERCSVFTNAVMHGKR